LHLRIDVITSCAVNFNLVNDDRQAPVQGPSGYASGESGIGGKASGCRPGNVCHGEWGGVIATAEYAS
jgi:hypothetical protein